MDLEKSDNIFQYISLGDQLKKICEKFHDKLILPNHSRQKYIIEDIYDGKLYRKRVSSEFISINFSLDGTPIFKSSNRSVYPVLCTLNELPPDLRKLNVMLVCLWFGKKKPKINEYLQPFVAECKKLYEEGVSYTFNGNVYKKKLKVLNGIADSIDRPRLRNFTQFNGEYGCGLCLNPGKSISKGNGHTQVYLMGSTKNPFGEGLRNQDDTLLHAENKEKGVKTKSILNELPEFDIILNLDVDWMHCVACGVCRQFCNAWFDSANHKKSYYLGKYIKALDKILTKYKPTPIISRTPRPLSDRCHWKAHEFIVWLLFYSIPTMQSIIPEKEKYINHWGLLVDGVFNLIKNRIMKSDVHYANKCLLLFVEQIESLYGIEHYTFNVHLLTHLPASVLNWGPLWTHSAFLYEDYNQTIKKFVKSSNGVVTQICDSFLLNSAINSLKKICDNHLSHRQKLYIAQQLHIASTPKVSIIVENISLLGPPLKFSRENKLTMIQKIKYQKMPNDLIKFYTRALIEGQKIFSIKYGKAKQRMSSCVLLKDGRIFDIEVFVLIQNSKSRKIYAFGSDWKIISNSPLLKDRKLNHLLKLKKEKEMAKYLLDGNKIKESVMILKSPKLSYTIACRQPTINELLT